MTGTAMTTESDPTGLGGKVETLAGFGFAAGEIALALEIDGDRIGTAFAAELARGAVRANARVAESLFRKATGEGSQSVTAAIFWMKVRAGWKEAAISEVTGDHRIEIVTGVPRPGDMLPD